MPFQQTTQAAQKPLYTQSNLIMGGVWRQGNLIVLRQGTPLPDRCLHTNTSVSGPRTRVTLYWYPPWLWLLLLFNWMILFIAAMFARKKIVLEIAMSQEMIRHRKRLYLIGAAVTASGVIEFLLGVLQKEPDLLQISIGLMALFGGLIVAASGSQTLTIQRVEGDYVWLKGASPAYLNGLSEWKGMPPN